MKLVVDLTDLELNEYFSVDGENDATLTEVFMNEITRCLVMRLKDTTECKRIVDNELHEPIRKAAREYLETGAVDEAVKECIKQKTRWDNITYYEAFKSDVEKIVDKKIKHFENKLEEAIKNKVGLKICEITEEVISQIYKNSSFADFIDKEKLSKKIVELLDHPTEKGGAK